MLSSVLLLTCFVGAFAFDPCTYGESFWCSDLRIAKKCGAVDHCMTTVWKQTVLLKDNSDTCSFCKAVVTDVKKMMLDHSGQQTIISVLKSACALLPTAQDVQECDDAVDNYLPEIMLIIGSELDSQAVCSALRICSGFEDSVPHPQTKPDIPVPKKSVKVGASAQCILCQFVMKEIDTMLADNATTAEIIMVLDKVCSVMPASVAEDCKNYIDTYGPAILLLLEEMADPAMVCSYLGLCPSNKEQRGGRNALKMIPLTAAKPIMPHAATTVHTSATCGICETVMQYVDSLLWENATVQEIEQLLDKVCNYLPSTLASQCDDLVSQYGPQIVQLLAQMADPQTVCTAIGLCTNTSKTAPVVEEPVVRVKAPLLGANPCTYGPAYWCSSKEAAKECKAVEYCTTSSWKH